MTASHGPAARAIALSYGWFFTKNRFRFKRLLGPIKRALDLDQGA